jgi:hypothetical protein
MAAPFDPTQHIVAYTTIRPIAPQNTVPSGECGFSSGVLGVLKGKSEIEKALADQMKKAPKITLNLLDAHQNGNVVWYYLDFMFPNGPSGHAGVTAVNDAGSWHIAMHVSNVPPPNKQ